MEHTNNKKKHYVEFRATDEECQDAQYRSARVGDAIQRKDGSYRLTYGEGWYKRTILAVR